MKQREKDIVHWYQIHGDAILNYILMMARDYQVAEDLTQETFVKAYRFYETYNHQASEKTWLFSIARNTTVDYMRKKKPLQLLKEAFVFSRKDESPSPEEFLLMKENSKELYLTLTNMRTAYKEVITLMKIKGFSIQETAKILNWSESKVKITLHRAICELEKRLKMG
jgi:RNA polymerase sigma-70 factor (ECF subfamily)